MNTWIAAVVAWTICVSVVGAVIALRSFVRWLDDEDDADAVDVGIDILESSLDEPKRVDALRVDRATSR